MSCFPFTPLHAFLYSSHCHVLLFLCPKSSFFNYLVLMVLPRFAGRNGIEWLNALGGVARPLTALAPYGSKPLHPSKKGHIIKRTLTLKKTQKALLICRSSSTIFVISYSLILLPYFLLSTIPSLSSCLRHFLFFYHFSLSIPNFPKSSLCHSPSTLSQSQGTQSCNRCFLAYIQSWG
jgi:hypothetical protein